MNSANSVNSWTREYFLSNQEKCLKQLNELTTEERISLKDNLNLFQESGSLVLIDQSFFVTDIKEPEFYCEKYVIKKPDGSLREESGKFCERLNISEDEEHDQDKLNLEERQICIISESSNKWILEHELNNSSSSSNKRKFENGAKRQQKYLVKIYDKCEVLLNELVEIVGFIYPNSTSSSSMEIDEFGDEVDQQLPLYTIHAIKCSFKVHNNPLLDITTAQDSQDMIFLHGDIHRFLTQFLFGDEIAAQYMLCHLISKVYARVNDEPLGKFTLNLLCHAIPAEVLSEYTVNLYSIIETLIPNSVYFPLTIEKLNTSSLVPRKDYTKNRLVSGMLQQPKHTHIILDETKLQNGKLDQAGCMAISDLSELIRTQQLSYDFQFYKIPYKTDLPVLILSEGKSLLPVKKIIILILPKIINYKYFFLNLQSDFAIPIKPIDVNTIHLINESIKTGIHCMKPKLNSFRRYLTACRVESFDIGLEETKMIETDFVKMRENGSNFQVEDLHMLLVLSRLNGIARGQKKLDTDAWELAKKMEIERNSRLEKKLATNEP